MNRLEELKKKYAELGAEIEKLEKCEKPKKGDSYYVIDNDGDILCAIEWENRTLDEARYEFGNVFKAEEEAEAVAEKLKIYTQLKRLAKEINTEPVDWEKEEQKKYCFYLINVSNELVGLTAYKQQDMCVIYSTNKDFLKIAKERIGEENLLKLFKE